MRPRFGLAKWAWVLHSGHATTFLLWGETFVDLYRTHGVSLQSNRSEIESLEGFLVETVIWRVISLTKTLVRSERIEHDGHKKQPVSLCAKSFLQSWSPFSVIRPQYLRPHGFGGYFSVLFGKYSLWFKVVVLIPDMENNRIDVTHSARWCPCHFLGSHTQQFVCFSKPLGLPCVASFLLQPFDIVDDCVYCAIPQI